MPNNSLPTQCPVSTPDLVYIWAILENLTVSFARIGSCEAQYGKEYGKDALDQYINPALCERLAEARHRLVVMLETCDPAWGDELERLATNEAAIGYWQRLKRE